MPDEILRIAAPKRSMRTSPAAGAALAAKRPYEEWRAHGDIALPSTQSTRKACDLAAEDRVRRVDLVAGGRRALPQLEARDRVIQAEGDQFGEMPAARTPRRPSPTATLVWF
jgi:hypothetical protein